MVVGAYYHQPNDMHSHMYDRVKTMHTQCELICSATAQTSGATKVVRLVWLPPWIRLLPLAGLCGLSISALSSVPINNASPWAPTQDNGCANAATQQQE